MVPAVQLSSQAARRLAVTAAAAGAAALCAAMSMWLARLGLSVASPLEDADTPSLLTALSAVGCAVVMVRIGLSLTVVAVASALSQGTIAEQRCRGVALALSPRWTRPAVALLLAAGVTAAGGACTRPPPAPALTLSGEIAGDVPLAVALPVAAVPGPDSARSRGGSISPATPTTLRATVPRSLPATAPRMLPPRMPPTDTRSGPAQTTDGGRQAASGPGPPGTGWLGMSVLPDPVWTALPEPGWVPSPPPAAPLLPAADAALVTSGAQRASGSVPRAAWTADDRVVVRRGDSLWSITARHLGPGASDVEVAAQWPRWWRANRAVIGPDPDLLLPGTRLIPPLPVGSEPDADRSGGG